MKLRNEHNRDLLLFLGIAFLLPLAAVCLMNLTESVPVRFLLYGVEAASPSAAAIVVAVRNGEFRSFFFRSFRAGKPAAVFVLPAAVAFGTMLSARLISRFLFRMPFAWQGLSGYQAVVIGWSFVAEELGWRGYLQPVLCKQIKRPVFSPLIVGVIWGCWHYHYFWFGGTEVPFFWFFAGCIAESYLYCGFLKWSGGSLFSAMTYHFAWNLFLHLFALNPAENGGSPLPYAAAVLLEILLCSLILLQRNRLRGK